MTLGVSSTTAESPAPGMVIEHYVTFGFSSSPSSMGEIQPSSLYFVFVKANE